MKSSKGIEYDMFNEPCKCNHRADEHHAGGGQCFICWCTKFKSKLSKEQSEKIANKK